MEVTYLAMESKKYQSNGKSMEENPGLFVPSGNGNINQKGFQSKKLALCGIETLF